jgi:transcriptional regulator with XRE-family HTH domain
MTKAYLSQLLAGTKDNPNLELLRTLARLLDVSVGWLAGDDVPRERAAGNRGPDIPSGAVLAADYELLSEPSRRSIGHMVRLARRAEARPALRQLTAPNHQDHLGGTHPFPAIQVQQHHHLTVEAGNLLGQRLRTLRLAAAMPPGDAAIALAVTEQDIIDVERGKRDVSEAELGRLLTLYGVDSAEQRALIHEVARGEHAQAWWLPTYFATTPPWFATMLAAEADARVIRAYGAEAVPPLLQTEAYVRAARQAAHYPDHAPEQVEVAVRVVKDRQREPIDRQSAKVWAIIRETALLDMPGGPDVQVEQLSHLIDLAKQDHITLRINGRQADRYQPRGSSFTILQRVGKANLVYVTGLVEDQLISRPELVDEYLVAHLRLDMSAEREEGTLEILNDLRRRILSQ